MYIFIYNLVHRRKTFTLKKYTQQNMNVLPRKPKIIWFDFSLPEIYQNLLHTRVTLSRTNRHQVIP